MALESVAQALLPEPLGIPNCNYDVASESLGARKCRSDATCAPLDAAVPHSKIAFAIAFEDAIQRSYAHNCDTELGYTPSAVPCAWICTGSH
jgi:hypothetical protein